MEIITYEIYGIINKVNNKIYIGQTKQGYRKRFIQHLCPKDRSPLLNNAIKKYKKENYILSKHPRAKKVKCVELNKIYNCVKEAELDMNINSKHIGQVANKRYGRKTAGGYHWIWM